MIPTGAIPTAPGARRTWDLPPLTRPGRCYVLAGVVLVAQADGTVQPWPAFAHSLRAGESGARRTS